MPQHLPRCIIEKIINLMPFKQRFMFMLSTHDPDHQAYFKRRIAIDMAPERFQTRLFVRTQCQKADAQNKKARYMESDVTMVTTKSWPAFLNRKEDFVADVTRRFPPPTILRVHEELISISRRNIHVNMISDRTICVIDSNISTLMLLLECHNTSVVQVNFRFYQDPSKRTRVEDEEEMSDLLVGALWIGHYWGFRPCSERPIQVEISKNVTGWGKRRAKRWVDAFTKILENQNLNQKLV